MVQNLQFPEAVATVRGGTQTPDVRGTVEFFQQRDGVLVIARITGLPANDAGFFGFHIHEGDRCTGADFADTGSHFNPTAQPHPLHAGDLPPLLSCDGTAYLSVLTNRFRLYDVIGRTVVIHDAPDDFVTQPAGNAGTKIACGVIRGR